MPKIKVVPDGVNEIKYYFQCPGCDQEHAFDKRWQFNQDLDKPTIHPSFLIKGGRHKEGAPYNTEMFVCHSFIKDGKIQFLGDCTHDKKNQTVDLIDY